MAFYPKYRSQFRDHYELQWKIDFEIEAEETVIDMEPTGEPLIFELLSSTDDILLDPIKGSKASIGVYSPSHFYYQSFNDATDLQIRVSIYYGSTLYWRGFLSPKDYSEAYDGIGYAVSIAASDGLGLLTNMLFVDGSGDYYTGRRTESQIIFDILSKIGASGFYEMINIYEENMDSDTDDSPLDQTYLDCSLFMDLYCYDVLASILKKYNAIIRQYKGIFYIYKPTDLNQASVYCRSFTSGTSKTLIGAIASDQFLRRTTNQASNICDFEGGSFSGKSAAKKININQDYGYKDSWIFNWMLQGKTYDNATDTFRGWVSGTYWVKYSIPGDPDGAVIPESNYNPPDDMKLSQEFGVYALESDDMFIFSFAYKFINYSGASRSVTVYLRLKSATKYLYVVDEEIAAWNDSEDNYEFTETVPEGKGDWNIFERKIEGIPENGTYTIEIYGTHASGSVPLMIIKDFRFYATSDLLTIKRFKKPSWWRNIWSLGREKAAWKKNKQIINYEDVEEIALNTITRENAIEGTEEDFDLVLGDVSDSDIDNVLEQFNGSLGRSDIIGYTGVEPKINRVTRNTTEGDASITCNGYNHTMYWDESNTQSITTFVNSNPDYGTGITLINNNDGTFDFSGESDYIEATIYSGYGSAEVIQEYDPGTPIIGVVPTLHWNSRSPGGEDSLLLEILADELQNQLSRTRKILQLPFYDEKTGDNDPHFNPLKNLQDDLNQYDSSNRKFVFNRGTFDVRNREWNADFIEIIP
jgi:hypothetical protein